MTGPVAGVPRSRWLIAGTAAVLIVALVVAGRLIGVGSSVPPSSRTPPPATQRPGPLGLGPLPDLAAVVPIHGYLTNLAVAPGALWVAVGGSVERVDPVRRGVVATIRVTGGVDELTNLGLAVGSGAVWVSAFPDRVVRIDPRTDRIAATIRLAALGLVAADGSIWGACCGAATRRGRGRLLRIDPRTDRVRSIPLTGPVGPAGPAAAGAIVPAGDGTLWVPVGPNGLERVDPRTGRVLARVTARGLVGGPSYVTAGPIDGATLGAGSLWVSLGQDGELVRADPRTGRVQARIQTGGGASVAVAGDGVWTTCGDQDPTCAPYLLRIDPATDRVAGTFYAYGDPADELAPAPDGVWVAALQTGAVLRIVPRGP